MTHEEAFLQEILETHDDDTPRRIFADWLMDRGDAVSAARGEFIHVQCDLARFAPDARRPPDLLRRERDLLAAHGREWGTPFFRLGCRCWEYRRGFVAGVGLPASSLLAHAPALFRLAPLREVKLYEASGLLADLAGCPALAPVRVLDLEKNELGDADLAGLAGPNRLADLRSLMLWSNRISDAGLHALAAAAPPRLETLDLSGNVIGNDGAAALADSPFFGRLRRVALSNNRVGDAGALALAGSPFAATLGLLDLAKNPIGPAGTAALRQTFGGRVHVLG
ncbi:MAG: TIGR02996 domain-containing protein [Gemmataceae bacterium]